VEAERAARTCGATFAILICKSALAQTLFERGDRISAHTTLAETLELARAIGSSHLEQFALLVDADWAFRERDISRGFGSLRTAFELGREHGFLACGWWRPEVIAGLCTRALEGGVEVDYARRLVRAHRLRPDPALPAPEAWPWPIRIRALGGFEIEVNDSPVVAMGKAQRKPIALLKVVIALGHPAVREREVADALWPEAEGDAAQQSLAVTLHRLRRLLGDDGAVRRHEGRLELDPSRAWSDVAALASILERTARATGEERAGLLGSGLQLYRGPLLADDDEAWTVEPRERLRGRLVREVAEVARSYESSDPDRAVNWYLKALDADPRAEGVYRRLIALYERLGRRAEALAVYERCDATLRASLGVNPSRDTEAIVRALRSSS
jgi:DNA-binding SARP family transcriptional activator